VQLNVECIGSVPGINIYVFSVVEASPPINVSVMDIRPVSITMSWNKPGNPHGTINAYSVVVINAINDTDCQVITLTCCGTSHVSVAGWVPNVMDAYVM
jgi:hypothetical protein